MRHVSIGPIQQDDCEYVAQVMSKRWGIPLESARADTRSYLAMNAERAGFCARIDGRTIGVGLFDIENAEVFAKYKPWVFLLWVDPEFRGRDIGIKLTRLRMEHARRFGYRELYLDTHDAPEYHRRLGWQDVEVMRYNGRKTWIMKWDLNVPFPKLSL